MAGGSRGLTDLQLATHGAALFAGAARAMIPTLSDWYDNTPSAPGTRITRLGALAPFLTGDGPVVRIAKGLIGPHARPVRAIAFDKSPGAKWSLGWH
jgi:hypothetical protein